MKPAIKDEPSKELEDIIKKAGIWLHAGGNGEVDPPESSHCGG
jgi:hypothetical protein